MHVDEQTIRDLEIFEATGGDPSLFDLLNRCRTPGGADALRARFRRPLSRADEIRAVQDSLRHIAENRAAFDLLPESAQLTALEVYLHSNLPVLTRTSGLDGLVEALGFRYGDRKVFQQMLSGVARTAATLRALGRFASRGELKGAPGELATRMDELRTLLLRPAIVAMSREEQVEASWRKALHFDRELRREERPTVERLMRLCFELDALVSMSDVGREYGYILPDVHDGPTEVLGEDVYHPFLIRAVANPVDLAQPRRLLFVTGPNMAGKTTYLRACGTAVYLAHLGMGVPARGFRFSPCDVLFSAITLVDSVRGGVSFFRAEALRVKRLAQALADGQRVFGMLDEPFKGTNVKDAVDASRAVFAALADADDSVFLVSSHLTEVAESLEPQPTVRCARFEAHELEGRLRYDFVIRPGISKQRLGVRVLEEEGVFELLARMRSRGQARDGAAD